MMKPSLTMMTRGVVYLMGLSVVAVCGILLPELAREEAVGKPNPPSALPFLIGAWGLSIPIFIALHQTLKLVNNIANNKAFSPPSVKALQHIRSCSLVFAALIALAAITVILVARSADPSEDVTPVVTFGFIFIFVSSVIATLVAVLQKLLQEAISIKSENDLTI